MNAMQASRNWTFFAASLLFLSPCCVLAQHDDPDAAVGYMLDHKGQVAVIRGTESVPTTLSCVALVAGDSVSLGAASSATVVLPTCAYSLHRPGKYTIREQEVMSNDKAETLDPVMGSRGGGNPLLSNGPLNVVMPPHNLFAAVKPPLMRAGSRLTVLSPCGVTFTTTPDLVWTGAETNEYLVEVVSYDTGAPEIACGPVSAKGAILKWSETRWNALQRDRSYRVVLIKNGVALTDEDQSFRVANEAMATRVQNRLTDIEKALPAGCGREFVKASLLASPEVGCYAEARRIVVSLLKGDPKNVVYLKLMQRCYAEMGNARGYNAVERCLSGQKQLPQVD